MKRAIGIFVTDTHLDKGNGELVKDIFNQLIDLCRKYKVNRIFHGGDVFTNRSGQPLQCLTDWKEIIMKLEEHDIDLHVIPGNHDKTDSDDDRSYLDVFSSKNVYLYRSGTFKIYGRLGIGFIPYYRDEKWLNEFEGVESCREANELDGYLDATFLITHSGFDGVRNNDGSVVTSLIKPSMFKKWTRVLIGHYHDASELAKNVVYTGSAYQNNYAENIVDKGFTVMYEDGSIEHVQSHFPKYIKHTIAATDKETLCNLLEKYEGESYDHIRFVFTGRKDECQSINISEIETKYGIDCKFVADETAEAIQISEDDSVLCYDKKSIVKDFIKFCSENQIRGDKMKYGLDLVKNF